MKEKAGTEMNLLDIICTRRSVRRYQEKAIPEETLDRILKAGLLAPSGKNKKPCEFYVVKDREILSRLSRAKDGGGAMLENCAAAVVVCADSSRTDTWVEDCSVALSYMNLEACEQGVGSCWVQIRLRGTADGADAEQTVRTILGLEEQMRIVGILSLGLPAGAVPAHELKECDDTKVHEIGI